MKLGAGPYRSARRLILVLGDQLDARAQILEDASKDEDVVLMAEVAEEAEHVPSHKQRTALFLAAMRHFGMELLDRGWQVRYVTLDARGNSQSLGSELARAIEILNPERVVVTRPGDRRVERQLERACREADVPLDVEEDLSFTCSLDEFREWAEGRKTLTMEYFYRERRKKLDLLMTDDGKPEGGQWNFDKQNREIFDEPPKLRRPYQARPDELTREVLELVEGRWPDAPGSLDGFDWPVTRAEARRALDDFIEHRLNGFGTYEDALWHGEELLYHSRLSSSLNLKLLRPMECVEAAILAYETGEAPINDVEGFVRQIVGWREFIRGVYYLEGEGYRERNELGHEGSLPELYWTGETDMRCLADCLGDVVGHAYAHHIPRLMVMANFALIAGITPLVVHEWFLAMYVDAVDWVTAPNVVGMALHADGGVVGSKPYAASGKYIQRMSNYCSECRYDVKKRSGENACPFNVFYWDFLARHRERFADNNRMAMILKNVDRMDESELDEIRRQAERLRDELSIS